MVNKDSEQALIIANEKISYQEMDLKQCKLSQLTSDQYVDKGTIKAVQTKSISDSVFNDLAEFASNQVKSSNINNSVNITDKEFIEKSSVINALLVI